MKLEQCQGVKVRTPVVWAKVKTLGRMPAEENPAPQQGAVFRAPSGCAGIFCITSTPTLTLPSFPAQVSKWEAHTCMGPMCMVGEWAPPLAQGGKLPPSVPPPPSTNPGPPGLVRG